MRRDTRGFPRFDGTDSSQKGKTNNNNNKNNFFPKLYKVNLCVFWNIYEMYSWLIQEIITIII